MMVAINRSFCGWAENPKDSALSRKPRASRQKSGQGVPQTVLWLEAKVKQGPYGHQSPWLAKAVQSFSPAVPYPPLRRHPTSSLKHSNLSSVRVFSDQFPKWHSGETEAPVSLSLCQYLYPISKHYQILLSLEHVQGNMTTIEDCSISICRWGTAHAMKGGAGDSRICSYIAQILGCGLRTLY